MSLPLPEPQFSALYKGGVRNLTTPPGLLWARMCGGRSPGLGTQREPKFILVPVFAAALAQPQMLAGPGPQVQALAATPRPQTAMEVKSKSVVKGFVALHPQTTGRFPCIVHQRRPPTLRCASHRSPPRPGTRSPSFSQPPTPPGALPTSSARVLQEAPGRPTPAALSQEPARRPHPSW